MPVEHRIGVSKVIDVGTPQTTLHATALSPSPQTHTRTSDSTSNTICRVCPMCIHDRIYASIQTLQFGSRQTLSQWIEKLVVGLYIHTSTVGDGTDKQPNMAGATHVSITWCVCSCFFVAGSAKRQPAPRFGLEQKASGKPCFKQFVDGRFTLL